MDSARRELLLDLVNARVPIASLAARLGTVPWDPPDDERIELTPSHVLLLVERSLRGDFDREELSRWASLLEMREDIDTRKEDRERVIEAIFWLANPDVNGALTDEWLSEIAKQLR